MFITLSLSSPSFFPAPSAAHRRTARLYSPSLARYVPSTKSPAVPVDSFGPFFLCPILLLCFSSHCFANGAQKCNQAAPVFVACHTVCMEASSMGICCIVRLDFSPLGGGEHQG